jgi:hypothetical protein
VRSAVPVGTQSRLKSTSRIVEERRWWRWCGRVMRDGDPTVHQLPNRKSISVIFITARSYPFSPLFQQETNGHADL